MSTSSRPLVTIDDEITVVEPHRVLLEWVEIVERQGFRVRSRRGGQGDEVYNHDQEGVTWARGHHLPDSDVVVALRAATSLVPREENGGSSRDRLGAVHSIPPRLADIFGSDVAGDIDEPIKSFKEAMDESRKNLPSWWTTMWGRRRV